MYETRVISKVHLKEGDEIFSESCTTVEIADEAGGEFVTVRQSSDSGGEEIKIDPIEWPSLRALIDEMIDQCRS